MKIAVVSDIHGNYKAFEAFLSYIDREKADGAVCLGDYLTDSPYPQRTIQLLYDMRQRYSCQMVRGNREDLLINNYHKNQGWKPSSANGALYYTAQHVTQMDIRFLEGLPMVRRWEPEGLPPVTLCHGSPTQIRGNFMEKRQLMHEALQNLDTPWLLGGHSHHQEIQKEFGKTYLNPGSLGIAIDGVGRRAQFAMLHGRDGEWEAELMSIPYDVEGFLQDFTACGLDSYGMILNRAIKKTLVTGVNYFYRTVLEAHRISGKEISQIPEEIWEQVAVRLEL